jgi:hypothetical protein
MASPALYQCPTACTGAVSFRHAGWPPPFRPARRPRSRRGWFGSRASCPCRPSIRCSASQSTRTSSAPCSRRCCGLRNGRPIPSRAASRSPRPHRPSWRIRHPANILSTCARSRNESGPTEPATAAGRSHEGSSARSEALRPRSWMACETSSRSRSGTTSPAASTSPARTPRSSRSCSRANGRRRSPRAANARSRHRASVTTRRRSVPTPSPSPSGRETSSRLRRTRTGRASRPASRRSRSCAFPRSTWPLPSCAPGRSTSCRCPTGGSLGGLPRIRLSSGPSPSCAPSPSSP